MRWLRYRHLLGVDEALVIINLRHGFCEFKFLHRQSICFSTPLKASTPKNSMPWLCNKLTKHKVSAIDISTVHSSVVARLSTTPNLLRPCVARRSIAVTSILSQNATSNHHAHSHAVAAHFLTNFLGPNHSVDYVYWFLQVPLPLGRFSTEPQVCSHQLPSYLNFLAEFFVFFVPNISVHRSDSTFQLLNLDFS